MKRGESYKKYGKATNCQNGRGGSWANNVYQIEGEIPIKLYHSMFELQLNWERTTPFHGQKLILNFICTPIFKTSKNNPFFAWVTRVFYIMISKKVLFWKNMQFSLSGPQENICSPIYQLTKSLAASPFICNS